jgi:hypothetical protein
MSLPWKFLQRSPELYHADRRTDLTKLLVAFRNFANAPKTRYGQKKFDIATSQCNVRLLQIGPMYDIPVIRFASVASCLVAQRVYCECDLWLRLLGDSTYILGVCVLCFVIRKMNQGFGLNELEEIKLRSTLSPTNILCLYTF